MRDHSYTSSTLAREPRESKVQRLIRWNFWTSLLAFVAMVGWAQVVLVRTGVQIAPISLGPDPVQWGWTNPGGIEYAVGELLLALFFYRRGGAGARGAAALAGLMLMAGLLVLVGSVAPGESANSLVTRVMLYTIASHLLYAGAGSSRRLR